MKKIKYLLLGIVSLLGIGCSFSFDYTSFFVDYYTISGGITSHWVSNDGAHLGYPMLINYTAWQPWYNLGSAYIQNSYNSDINTALNGTYGNNFEFMVDTNGNRLGITNTTNAALVPKILRVITSTFGSDSSVAVDDSVGVYARILGDSSCLDGDVMYNSSNFCDTSFIEVFAHNLYTISSLGTLFDSDYNSMSFYKGPVSPSVGLGYSFGIAVGSGWTQNGNNYYLDLENGDYFILRSVFFSGSSLNTIENVLTFRLNTSSNTSDSSDYQIMAITQSGTASDYSFIYSIYNCSATALKDSDCSFFDGGFISGDVSYNFTSSDPYSNLIYFLTQTNSVYFKNTYSSTDNSLVLSTHPYSTNYNINKTITLNLIPTDGIDIIGGVPDNSQGGNQYTGSGTISLSGCVDTELCTYKTGSDGNTLKLCHTSCVSQDVIDSGGYISYDGTYYFVNTPLSLDDLKNSDLTFSTGYLDSGGILDPVFFEDLFDPTKKAVGVCPFPYYSGPLDFLSNIGFDGVYLFMPLICFYSAFQHGAHLSYFDDPNIITGGVLSSPLFHGNSENHRIFFMFLDVLLSIGLLGLFHHLSSLL